MIIIAWIAGIDLDVNTVTGYRRHAVIFINRATDYSPGIQLKIFIYDNLSGCDRDRLGIAAIKFTGRIRPPLIS